MRCRSLSAAIPAAFVCLILGTPLYAQPVKPHILMIFDTSGSMLNSDGTCDGQNPPVGNGSWGNDSRIYNVKEAMSEALFFVGTDEANFGLMRFPQWERACTLDNCPFDQTVFGMWLVYFTAGYYQVDGNAHWGGADDWPGCVMGTHNNQTTYGTWFDNGAAEAIVVPVTDPAGGLDPPNSSFFDPTDANIPEILRWLDHTTTCSGGNITNPEIQAIGSQFTPLGRSLFYARLYFTNYVIPNDDPIRLPCRNTIIILLTDGAERCDSGLGGSNPPCNGGDQFNPYRQACLTWNNSGIPVHVITTPDLAQPGDAPYGIAQAGGTGAPIPADFTDQDQVKSALLQIIAEAVPSGEVCNNIDDDCDGLTDEGWKNACTTYPAWCAVEICDGLDNTCDGLIDEGLPPNACGGPCGEPLPPEICDGIDNDCDGLFDTDDPDYFTGPDASCPCTVEVCDDVDNDCDGLTDTNDPDYQVPSGACGGYPATGECDPGHWECGPNPNNNNQVEEHCVGGQGPTPEICDGLDNDCNGVTDDVAYNPPDCVVPDCQTGCCDGHWECVNGVDTCVPDAVGEPEICDGLDNDCDLRIDEGAECADPLVCFYGECVYRIPPDGCGTQYPVEGLCVDDPCVAAHCQGGWTCDVTLGDPNNDYCYDPCTTVQCTPPEACDVVCDQNGCRGECAGADCYLDPTLCVDGEVCKNGQCEADACFGTNALDCGNQACRDGACVDTCVAVNCNADQECVDGQCVDLDCDSSRCPPGRICVLGQCAQDPCGGVTCRVGHVCRDGVCIDDPCRLIVCPTGSVCDSRGQCVEETAPQPDAGVIDAATTDGGAGQDAADGDGGDGSTGPQDMSLTAGGGGGCTCEIAHRRTPASVPLILTLLILIGAGLRFRKRGSTH